MNSLSAIFSAASSNDHLRLRKGRQHNGHLFVMQPSAPPFSVFFPSQPAGNRAARRNFQKTIAPFNRCVPEHFAAASSSSDSTVGQEGHLSLFKTHAFVLKAGSNDLHG